LQRAEIERAFTAAVGELRSYRELPIGWNGYDSDPIDPVAIRFAQQLLARLLRSMVDRELQPSEVTPSPSADGGVGFEIALESRRLILTVSPGASSVNVLTQDGGVSDEKDVGPKSPDLEGRLVWLMGPAISSTTLV
jgi:hypothetical protein